MEVGTIILRNVMLNRKWVVVFCILFFWFTGNVAFGEDTAFDNLIKASKARAAIVKKVQDAVVHIRVEKVIHGQGTLNNPYDLFNDEFFERFFPGVPRPRAPENPHQDNKGFKQEGMGSGTIIDKNGHILTNHHVVGEADKVLAKLNDGRELEARLIGTDPQSDIAVVKIDATNLPVIPMGDSDDMEVGESVVAIGNPFGLTQTVTFGIISATGRSNIGITDYENFIQTDAAINPGNSGGPLINLRGEIIGVNTAIFTRSGGYQGIGFSVPINMARRIMEDLIEKGSVSRGWLGVSIQDIDSRLAKAFGLESTNGSLITGIMSNTPAEAAGFQKGDVVVRLNGNPIRSSNQFRNEIAAARANTTVDIELIRKGKIKKIKVLLGERPKDPMMAQKLPEAETYFGITVENVTAETSEKYGYEKGAGALITRIDPDSPAADAGLRSGVLITEVDRKIINSVDDFEAAMKAANVAGGVLFLIQTKQGSRYIIVSE
ncbi:MAG: Do family serine endopeptidase [SAR324 cluster bacterium]|nr:Do family serine endopeptidase [SAR324 cluster bacterium]